MFLVCKLLFLDFLDQEFTIAFLIKMLNLNKLLHLDTRHLETLHQKYG